MKADDLMNHKIGLLLKCDQSWVHLCILWGQTEFCMILENNGLSKIALL